ncbi:MAG: ATP phosphoribosyltransferase [Candidatus Coproplasma sp.]
MINIALPKGRLGEKVYNLLSQAGYGCSEYSPDSRKLIFRDEDNGVSYFWVKPSDVWVYVQSGAADIGVAGKDIIDEYAPDVYELADLGLGKCRMCVASKSKWIDDQSRPLRVATKFVYTAKRYYEKLGRDIEIIKLNGSIELAPVVGMSDVIVDIVETGTTLKENDLKVFETISAISARLIANRTSFKFKNKEITQIAKNLQEVVEK